MEKNTDYVLPFVGLSAGKHLYEYKIGDSFFEAIAYSEIKKGTLDAALTLNKQFGMLVLDFSINGTVNVPCDRCNEPFDLEVESNNRLVVNIGGEEMAGEDTISIPATVSEINLAEYIYEYLILSLPIQRVHPDNKQGKMTCDKEAMKIYNKYIKKEEKTKTIDPRWEKLKGLDLNN